jgi:hypothetical protein
MTKRRLSSITLYTVVAIYCLFGGSFAAFMNWLLLQWTGEPLTAFVSGTAGSLATFFAVFFTVPKEKL